MRPGGAHPAQGDDLVAFREPQMEGSLVVPVHILIHAVLLHDENLAADPQEFVELVHRQVGKRFLMKNGWHGSKIRNNSYLCPRYVLEKTHICLLAAVGYPADGLHLPHHGHLSAGTATGECLVCQLLAQQFVPSENTAVQAYPAEQEAYVLPIPEDVIVLSFQPSSPRAPPVSFCR